MQMRQTNLEKGCWHEPLRTFILHDIHEACMLLMILFAVVLKTLCLVPIGRQRNHLFLMGHMATELLI